MPDKQRAYITGAMSGLPHFGFDQFDEAAHRLRRHGYRVINPADFGADPKYTWRDCLCRDLAMLAHVDVLATLPNWRLSRGATLEVQTARELDIPVKSVLELLQEPASQGVARDTLAVETESRMRKLSGLLRRWKGR